ncbi:MAG TPA: inositol-3-phosphate synthase, partial [Gemmata sp.]|nr:inositol-3-phosphate synthase [Gemmata sp.]
MAHRRVGLWFIGACGGVAGTAALGLSALGRGLTPSTGLVTALPEFARLDLDEPASFVVGGHEVRQATILSAVRELHARSGVFDDRLIAACAPDLESWSANLRPGVVFRPNQAITALADRPDTRAARTPREAVDLIHADLLAFKTAQKIDQLVVVNAASTEPPFELGEEHRSLEKLLPVLDRSTPPALPTSSIYAFAAIDAGFAYVNMTP